MVRFTISDHAIGRFRERFAPELSDTESRLLLSRLMLSAKRTGSSFRDRSVWSVNESGPFKGMRVVAKEGRFMGKGSYSIVTVLPLEQVANDQELVDEPV